MIDNGSAFVGTIIGAILGGSFPFFLSVLLAQLAIIFPGSQLFIWEEMLHTGIWFFVPAGTLVGAFFGCVASGLYRNE